MSQETKDRKPSLFAIFLNNKIITCDTAIPIAMEVRRQNPDAEIEIYVGHWPTYQMIQKNRVLWDAANRIGRIIFYGRSNDNRAKGVIGWIAHRVASMLLLLRLMLKRVFTTTVFMHFRALNHWPLRILYIINPRNTFLCEGIVTGYSENERLIDNTWRARVDYNAEALAKGGLIGFSHDWHIFRTPQHANTPKYTMGNFWYGSAWPEYVVETAEKYLAEDFRHARVEPAQKIIVYILGYLGAVESVPDPDTFKTLLRRTLEVLHDEAPDMPVFLKPHFNTDVDYVRNLISELAPNNFIISHLHPAVLSTRAQFLVANYYSTTMAVARSFGIPVVEYSCYGDKAREIAKGNSIRPDIVNLYVDNDKEKFRQTVCDLLAVPTEPILPSRRAEDLEIIARLAGQSS